MGIPYYDMNKVDVLKEGIKTQREWGNHKVADLLAAELTKIPECWRGSEEEAEI